MADTLIIISCISFIIAYVMSVIEDINGLGETLIFNIIVLVLASISVVCMFTYLMLL
jgi:hypothetical protein